MTRFILTVLSLMLFGKSLIHSVNSLQCKNEKNEDIDWFVIYKLPDFNIRTESKPFLVVKSEDKCVPNRKILGRLTSERKKATELLTNTLRPLSKKLRTQRQTMDEAIAAVEYHNTLDTSLGIIMANEKEGLWLIHNMESFTHKLPNLEEESFTFPDDRDGNLLMCISVDAAAVTTIALQLSYMQVTLDFQDVPETLKKVYPMLYNIKHNRYLQPNGVSKETIRYKVHNPVESIANEVFTYVAADDYKEDLYSYICRDLGKKLVVRWPYNIVTNDILPDACVSDVIDIGVNVAINSDEFYPILFNSKHDNSIWAISNDPDDKLNLFCFGSVGRTATKENLGGVAVCLKSSLLWESYYSLISVPCRKAREEGYC